ncbi:MAG TPA: lycopene cyclase domain-containing protein [Ktedonobacteraceae bacterium]|nr:lycopene cyclase domain-containing protein [Ktedonobacteraceae bacterium]
MTYAIFLLIFLVCPLGALAIALRRRLLNQRYLVLTGILMAMALAYMAPWDHIAAVWGLWTWTNNQTWRVRWWAIPPEEYLFCLLEVLMAITLTYVLFIRKASRGKKRAAEERS